MTPRSKKFELSFRISPRVIFEKLVKQDKNWCLKTCDTALDGQHADALANISREFSYKWFNFLEPFQNLFFCSRKAIYPHGHSLNKILLSISGHNIKLL